jgi:hypothetical protein
MIRVSVNDDPFENSWDNFVKVYIDRIDNDRSRVGSSKFYQYLVDEYNCHDVATTEYVEFDTEEDLAYFILRFS